MNNDTILTILKTDLQITAPAYDGLLRQNINLARKAIEREGIKLQDNDEDGMLVEMYAAWLSRKRKENIPMNRMLRYMLNNRLLSERMKTKDEEES